MSGITHKPTAFPGKLIGWRNVDRNVEYEDGLAAGLRRAGVESNPAPNWSVSGRRWEAGRRVALGFPIDDLLDAAQEGSKPTR